MDDSKREYRNMHRDKSRVIRVSAAPRRPALTREEQQRANRDRWDVDAILENCRRERGESSDDHT